MTDGHLTPVKHDKTSCVFCKSIRGFEMPDALVEQLKLCNVVIFAGAGVSTESVTVFPATFYDEVLGQVGVADDSCPKFSTLMSMFCRRPNGRAELIRKIINRLKYVESFPELGFAATTFHRELATLFYVNTIITTNWDDYFERFCGAIPLTSSQDFSLWALPGRKVFKIHGSASSVGSIVATDEDYARAHESLERGPLGSALKLALSTKTIVYVGYSLRDDDFLAIHNYLRRELGEMAPQSYVVSLDDASEGRFREMGLHPIFTDARYFVAMLKKHLAEDEHFLPDDRFDGIRGAYDRVDEEHGKLHRAFNLHKTPEIAFSACYQDGLMHAFERIMVLKRTGEYSHRCDVLRKAQAYEGIRRHNIKMRRYLDVAYAEGYQNGLFYLLWDDKVRKHLPYYYLYGAKYQPSSLSELRRLLKGPIHKAAAAHASRAVSRLGPHDHLHHPPFIGGGRSHAAD
ncbi:SIR2 family protein [Lysobacter sp. M15]|uniref:SIR2 family protein n=1 Tax=Lysobacter sp. M15 TaxID=2916837 RepID=UPI001F58B8BF|nr:SIR2 family protein [Lysobacter sp. M15]